MTNAPPRAYSYTFRDWLSDHKGQGLLYVSLDYWKELGEWPIPGRIFRWDGWLPELWYYVKCRLWRRYNVINVHTLPPTWMDADERMLHSMFAILEGVILKERIFENNEPEGDPNDKNSWAWALAEMRLLWEWWTIDRPAREARYDWALHAWSELHNRDRAAYTVAHPNWQETDNPHLMRWSLPEHVEPADTQAAWEYLKTLDDTVRDAEDTAMMQRLVAVRGYLWT